MFGLECEFLRVRDLEDDFYSLNGMYTLTSKVNSTWEKYSGEQMTLFLGLWTFVPSNSKKSLWRRKDPANLVPVSVAFRSASILDFSILEFQ